MRNTLTLRSRVLSKRSEKKLQERSAVLYTRALERWNSKPPAW